MNKCNCYEEIEIATVYYGMPTQHIICRCNGTKEQDECSCGGDRSKCDFYPEIREKAKKEKEKEKVSGTPVNIGFLYDWYISSVGDEEPIWTEAHIDELFNDFYLIPKEN